MKISPIKAQEGIGLIPLLRKGRRGGSSCKRYLSVFMKRSTKYSLAFPRRSAFQVEEENL